MSVFIPSILASTIVFGALSTVALITRNSKPSVVSQGKSKFSFCNVRTIVLAFCLAVAIVWVIFLCLTGGQDAFNGAIIGALAVLGSLAWRSLFLG